ncbi:MAG: hypothetical protein ACYC1F_04745, partial [Gallionellaceae bacterium]
QTSAFCLFCREESAVYAKDRNKQEQWNIGHANKLVIPNYRECGTTDGDNNVRGARSHCFMMSCVLQVVLEISPEQFDTVFHSEGSRAAQRKSEGLRAFAQESFPNKIDT